MVVKGNINLAVGILLVLLFCVLVKETLQCMTYDSIEQKNGKIGAAGETVDTISVSPHIGYHPEKWNCDGEKKGTKGKKGTDGDNCDIQHSHNCYTYVLDDQNPDTVDECKDRKGEGEACNDMFHQPGHYYQKCVKGKKNSEIIPNGHENLNCDSLIDQVKRDNKDIILFDQSVDGQKSCPDGYYMGALTVDPGRMYHFYRRDQWSMDQGKYYWSHKDGGAKATNLDASGKQITDPAKANRKYNKYNYSEVCPYFCVPENNLRDTLSTHRSSKYSKDIC